MLILSAADVRDALPMSEAIEAMKAAFAALSGGLAVVPHRASLPVPRHAGVSLVMSAYVDSADLAARALAVKVVSLFEGNRSRGLERIQATVLLFEPDTGRLEAILDGASLTAIRTAAASGAATDLLSRADSRTLAVFGAGVQSRAHIEAVCAVRAIDAVRVYCRTRAHGEALVREFQGRVGTSADLTAVETPREALKDADIVCTTTTAQCGVFDDRDLGPGTHINAVGSYRPDAWEIPPETIARSRVVVDGREAALIEAGDLIRPLRSGLITADHIQAELGEIVLGRAPGRTGAQEITVFKSVGIAVQDAFAARRAVANARVRNLGRSLDW